MKTIYLRLVKGSGLYDRIIGWYTRSLYTHAEFSWPLDNARPQGWLGAQPKGGVEIRNWDYLTAPFDLFAVSVTYKEYALIEAWLKGQIGKPYAWKAIFNMGVFEHDVTSADKWFCSELVFAAFEKYDVEILRAPLSQRDRITPRDLGLSIILKPVRFNKITDNK